ncbi:FAD-binding oxidoreductase [Yoonia sp. SS1-5]|uniref:NAD(P)/FAD-dependent oxidoreductase n=1 Tax=Yoonia rhodophyticola TaxID=3137370 RepID=A0AAN0NLN0_9RHOB
MIDFLIIGGGIAGISAAARLSKLGQTTLLEAEDSLAFHASGRSAAMFEESYGNRATIALNKMSRAHHEAAQVLSPRGLLLVGGPEDADRFATDQRQMKLARITVDEAVEMVPILRRDRIDRAAYHADAWDIDTDKLIQGFAKEARQNGTQISTKSPVTSINRIPTGWEVNTSFGSYFAKNLVNAAGAWVDEVAVMANVAPLGFTPLRRSMARIPAPGGHDLRKWPMMFGPGESWYAKPDAGALIVSPADEDPVKPHDACALELPLAEGLMRYENNVTEKLVRLLATWAGLRTFAPDRALVLGPDPLDEHFIWCAGQGGYGMQTSPAASKLLADLVAGRPPALDVSTLAALTPGRLRSVAA